MFSKQNLEYQKKPTVIVNYSLSTVADKGQVTLRESGAVSAAIYLLVMNLKLMELPFTHPIRVFTAEFS